LERRAGALDTLERVGSATGLAWSPPVEDSPCFESLTNEPRYIAVVQNLRDRQKALRERLPSTLNEYGVADVGP
jgi:hypothetical protein